MFFLMSPSALLEGSLRACGPDWYRELARPIASHALFATVTPSRPRVVHLLSTKIEGGGVPFTVQELARNLKRVGWSHIQKFACGVVTSREVRKAGGYLKITPATSALMSSHLSHICTKRKGWHRSSTLCSAITLPLAKRCFKRPSASSLNCRTLPEMHLHHLHSAIGRLLPRGPQLRGGEGHCCKQLQSTY
jgi:hypothetical protein